MHFEVRNSWLEQADLDSIAAAAVQRRERESGQRGFGEVLTFTLEASASAAISVALATLWAAWRRRQGSELKNDDSSTVLIVLSDAEGKTVGSTLVDVSGDGADAIRSVEAVFEERGDESIQRITIVFPDQP